MSVFILRMPKGSGSIFAVSAAAPPAYYNVQWGGVVDEPRTVQTSYGPEEILSQVLPDGQYRWNIEAVEGSGAPQTVSGLITLQNADTQMPELHNFAVCAANFTPEPGRHR